MDSTVDHRLIERRSKRARRWFWAAIAGAMAVAFVMVAGLFTYCQFSVTALSQLCVDVCCGGATHILVNWRSPRPNEAHSGYSNWTGISFHQHLSGWDPAQVRGFGIYPQCRLMNGHQINLIMPWWIPLALSVTFAVLARRSANHWARRRSGRCARCGYDLTGNTTGRCPECGQPAQLPE